MLTADTGTACGQFEMLDIFKECQENSLSHDRLCLQLKNLYIKSRFNHFADEFFELCRYSLVSSERSAYRERTIDFITKFALFCGKSEENEEQDALSNRLLLKFFLFCMKYNECPNPEVRFRCMQIIGKLLAGMGDNCVMPDDLYTSLQSVLLRRVQDVKATVRVQAVHALARIQDPTDAECPAVEAFIWLARHDPTADVRRAALAAMVLTTRTLPSLVERCRDLSDIVRRTAYKILASRGVLRPLSIAKRIRILQDGLSDRSVDVRQAAQELVLAWFKATECDPVHLLRRLDTEGVPETSQLALDNLFQILPEAEFDTMVRTWALKYLTDERVVKSDCLSSETSFFWRALVEHLVKQQNNPTKPKDRNGDELSDDQSVDATSETPLLELVMPSLTAYVGLTKELIEKLVKNVLAEEFDEHTMELECVVVQTLQLASFLDLSDEFGRRQLVLLVRAWITSPTVPNTLSPPLLKLQALLEPNLGKRINDVIEMISELCDPTEPPQTVIAAVPSTTAKPMEGPAPVEEPVALSKDVERAIRLKIAKLEVRMNELNESLHNCVVRKDFESATQLRDQCAQLEAERSSLLQELRGGGPQNSQSNGSAVKESSKDGQSVRPEDQAVTDHTAGEAEEADHDAEDEEKVIEDGPQSLFHRCSTAVLLKGNSIAALLIQQSSMLWVLPASLRSLLDSLILPSIQHGDPSVRNQAILALGLCCTMDLPLALQYLPLFYSAMRVDHVMISDTALRCIVDCLLIYGFRPFHEAKIRPNTRIAPTDEAVVTESDDEEYSGTLSDESDFIALIRQDGPDMAPGLARREDMSKTVARLIKPIVTLLDSEDDDLQTSSALGLAKLLIYDRFISSQVLSQLLLLWFNPITEDRQAIRRGLACFFTDYACGNPMHGSVSPQSNYEHLHALANAVLPTLTALIRAPASSPLSEVESADVASLLARLTDTTHLQPQSQQPALPLIDAAERAQEEEEEENEDPSENKDPLDVANEPVKKTPCESLIEADNPHHDRLALQLASEVLKAPQSAEAKLYLRMLCQLHPSRTNLAVYKELLLLSDSMFKYADRASTLLLHRFRKLVNGSLERLGLNPEQVLAELKQKAKAEQQANKTCVPSPETSGELDRTLTASTRRMVDPNHPTLLGSARPNVHLLGDSTLSPCHLRGQSSRALPGFSILDKSGRITNLTFSDEDSEEDSQQLTKMVNEPKQVVEQIPLKDNGVTTDPNQVKPTASKINTRTNLPRVRISRKNTRRQSSVSSSDDGDSETQSYSHRVDSVSEKENRITRTSPRQPVTPDSPVRTRLHDQTKTVSTSLDNRLRSKSVGDQPPTRNVRSTRSSLSKTPVATPRSNLRIQTRRSSATPTPNLQSNRRTAVTRKR